MLKEVTEEGGETEDPLLVLVRENAEDPLLLLEVLLVLAEVVAQGRGLVIVVIQDHPHGKEVRYYTDKYVGIKSHVKFFFD